MILFFCRVWIRLINLQFYFFEWNKTNPMQLPEVDACPMHSALRASALDASKFNALDLSYFTRKSKCPFINLSVSTYEYSMKMQCQYVVGQTLLVYGPQSFSYPATIAALFCIRLDPSFLLLLSFCQHGFFSYFAAFDFDQT